MSDRAAAERLAAERQAARAARDFASADALRVRIRDLGFDVVDGPDGFDLRPIERPAPPVHATSASVPSVLDAPPVLDATVHWLVEGWPEDVERGIESFRRHAASGVSVQHVVVDASDARREWPEGIETIAVRDDLGWAASRNAGLRRSRGRVVVVVDGSVEATGDVVTPLLGALEDHTVGVTGPFGIVTNDLRTFSDAPGPDVDAVEGYVMAFRRDVLDRGVRFDERFRFYRTADIELSFQIKALGLRAVVTPVPLRRHEHRTWTTTPEERRDQLSKRNFYRFLDRWRGRDDLIVGGSAGPEA